MELPILVVIGTFDSSYGYDDIIEFELPLLLQTYNILGCISKNNMNPQHICFDDVRGLGNRVKKRSIGDKKKARSRYKWNVNCGRALEE